MTDLNTENPAGACATVPTPGTNRPSVQPPDTGATRAAKNVENGLFRFYHDVKGLNERNPATAAYEVLEKMELSNQLDWTVLQNAYVTGPRIDPGYPCSLVAFAACLPHPTHIANFYKRLMCNGLMDDDEIGPSGGMSLVGMIKALQQWEESVRTSTKKCRIRGMNLHHIQCKGSAIVEFNLCYTTTLTGTTIETNIIYLEDLDAKTGHFIAARAFHKNDGYKLLLATWKTG